MHDIPENSHMAQVDPDEVKLCEVGKHPFGIIILYIQALIGVIGSLALAFFLLPSVVENTDAAFNIALTFALIVMVLTAVIVLVATYVYRQSRFIVTDRNITQILQRGLFNRQVSQLNLVNVEDVTSINKGFFSTIFGYGEINIETAGEQANFKFTYCPRPGYYAKIILEAREKMLGQHDGDHRVDAGPLTTR